MAKTILITGATDGIGLAAARRLAAAGHRLIIHGRNAAKLAATATLVAEAGEATGAAEPPVTLRADLSRLAEAARLADEAAAALAPGGRLDALVNNAGVLKAADPRTPDGLDVRFAVNTIAPYILTKRLLARLGPGARVVNVASAAQAPVDLDALRGLKRLADMEAYAQSKLALIMWTRHLAATLGPEGPVLVAVNPGSLLATRMVREGFGVAGRDVGIGAEILARAATAPEFARASGAYFDNDSGRFADPHPDALDPGRCAAVVEAIEAILAARGLG